MAYIEMDYKSESLMRSVSLNIYLPCCDGWENAEKPYKTLYFLPGFSAGGKELSTMLSFRLQSMMKGAAVVIPDGDNSFYVDRPDRFAWYSKIPIDYREDDGGHDVMFWERFMDPVFAFLAQK